MQDLVGNTNTTIGAMLGAWGGAARVAEEYQRQHEIGSRNVLAAIEAQQTKPGAKRFVVPLDFVREEGDTSVADDDPITLEERQALIGDYNVQFRPAYLISSVLGEASGSSHWTGQFNAPLAKLLDTFDNPRTGNGAGNFEDMGGRLIYALLTRSITGVSVSFWRRLADKPGGAGPYISHVAALAGENPAISGLADLTQIEVPDEFRVAFDAMRSASPGSIRTVTYKEKAMPDDVQEPDAETTPDAAQEQPTEPTRAADSATAERTAEPAAPDESLPPALRALAARMEATNARLQRAVVDAEAKSRKADEAIERAEKREQRAVRSDVERAVADLGLRVPTGKRAARVDELMQMPESARTKTLAMLRAVPEPADLATLTTVVELEGGKRADARDTFRNAGHVIPDAAFASMSESDRAALAGASQHEKGSPEWRAALLSGGEA